MILGALDRDEVLPSGFLGSQPDALDEAQSALLTADDLRGNREEELVDDVGRDEIAEEMWPALAQDDLPGESPQER